MKRPTILSVAWVLVFFTAVTLPLMAEEGNSPREVYAVYVAAQQDGNIKGMCAYMDEEKVKLLGTMSEEEKTQLSELMKMIAPTEYIVVTEDIQGDNATLTLTGKRNDFGRQIDQSGTVRFVKEGGSWKVEKDSWEQIAHPEASPYFELPAGSNGR